MYKQFLYTLLCVTLTQVSYATRLTSTHQHGEYVTGYVSFATTNTYSEVLYPNNVHFTDGHAIGLGYGREFLRQQHWGLEGEVMGTIHFQEGETFTEGNILALGRWHTLPWDQWLNTSLGAGIGLSLASQVPPLEEELHGSAGDETAAFLAYLAFEVEAELLETQQKTFNGVVRVHHRSGAFGTFSGVDSGSNLVSTGLRIRF